MEEYHIHMKEIETELYKALEFFEQGDLIGVRQCSTRARNATISAWQSKNKANAVAAEE